MSDFSIDDFSFLDLTNRYDKKKNQLTISVFGSYEPNYKKRLRKVCAKIRKLGYTNTWIVEDRLEPERRPNETQNGWYSRRSDFWISKSDVLIWIFFYKADNVGIANEVGRIHNDNEKSKKSIYFFEVLQENKIEITSMIQGPLENNGIEPYQFLLQRDEQVIKLVQGPLFRNLIQKIDNELLR